MTVQKQLEDKIRSELDPLIMQVVNVSDKHKGHLEATSGLETHFEVLIVSERFSDVPRVQRFRMVHDLLAEELKGPIHALSMKLYSIKEWQHALASRKG